MSLLRAFGRKQLQQLSAWTGAGAVFGATVFSGVVYVSEWSMICDYIPFYNMKREE